MTNDFTVFRALSFICGVTTVTPQLMIPLVGDFAPLRRKASLLAIVVSGLMLGLLMARFLSGVVSNFTSWRNIYWFSCGAQYLLALVLFLFMPDYPSTNPDGLNYFRALWSIPYMMATEPVLIQSCLIAFTLSTIFTSFWTTLTFLLASPPYDYSSLQIGLFSLTAIATIISIPLIGRLIDRFVPLLSTIAGQILALIGTLVGTFISKSTVAGPIIQAIGIDIGMQTAQVANRAAIFNINPRARNRVNTAYMALAFVGQLTGTAVGNKLYADGGWKRSGACSSKLRPINLTAFAYSIQLPLSELQLSFPWRGALGRRVGLDGQGDGIREEMIYHLLLRGMRRQVSQNLQRNRPITSYLTYNYIKISVLLYSSVI